MSGKRFSEARPATLRGRLSQFLRDERGSIVLNFAITCTALLVLTGGAVDFARTSMAKTNLQNAADSAVLSIARNGSGATTQEALKEFATNYMAAMLPSDYDFEVTSVSRDGNLVQLSAEGSLEPGLSALAGFETLHQSTASEATWGTGKLEVALVLDNTGSMAEHSRMVEMKKAAHALLDELRLVGGRPCQDRDRTLRRECEGAHLLQDGELVQDRLVGELVLERLPRRSRPELRRRATQR